MRLLLRPANLFLVFSYALLSAVAFAPLLDARGIPDIARILAMEFVAWVAVWSIFRRPAWFHCLLLPAFIALPVELYLHSFYGQGISTHHLGIIAETSPKEALEFFGNQVWWLVLAMASVFAWWLAAWRAALKTRDLDWDDGSRWVALGVLGCAALVWGYGEKVGVRRPAGPDGLVKGSESTVAFGFPALSDWARIPFNPDAFARTWPFGIVLTAHDFWRERQYLANLAYGSTMFRFGARASDSRASSPRVVVMVIGESSRYDRWSLNGYQRDTNPLLRQERNLVSLSNVVTAVSATRLSVPVLVSRKPARQSLKAEFSERSFLSAFREAGFKTWWLSNQMSFGKFDTPVSVFAKEADVTQFLNFGGFTSTSSHDDILLAPLKAALDDPSEKKLVVLHSLGSHWNYSHRHPKEFDRWQPSLYGIENPAYTDRSIKIPLNNSYDNSVLYTDWFLSKVIGRLKATQRSATMMYVSDHGQALYDGSCNLAFHGHNTQFDFHIPALVWYSDAYLAAHQDKVHQLLRNKDARLATENVFHSLLDMADIRYDTEQLEWSFLSRKFKPHKRYVDSYGWSDYDNATFKGDCREVIDNGKPLAQEK